MSTVQGPTPEEWWAAIDESRLLLAQCQVCRTSWLPWSPYCPDCGFTASVETIESAGRGTLYAWTVIHRSMSAPEDTPFTIASVRLDEGAMVYGRLVDGQERLPVGDEPVEIVFIELNDRQQAAFRRPREE